MTSFAADQTLFEDEEMERVLREAGVENAPIDPSSVDALRQLVREHHQKKLGKDECKPAARTIEAFDSIQDTFAVEKSLEGSPSILTQSAASTGNSNSIMQQLEFQTRLLLDMQRKINELTAKVDRLERGEGVASTQPDTVKSTYSYSTTKYYRENAARFQTRQPPVVPQAQGEDHAAVAPQQQPQDIDGEEADQQELNEEEFWILSLLRERYRAMRDSRLVEIAHAFWDMSRDTVLPLDGAMLFKLMVMVVFLTARIQKQPSNTVRFYVSIVAMVVGFLWHTRYLQFMYQFFWRENVPGRIWNGQPAEGPPEVPETPQPPGAPVPPEQADGQQQENREEANGGWRNTFLGGGIAGRAENELVAFVQDILYLFGSFFFSIFPMWRPEGPPPPPPLPHPGQEMQEGGIPEVAPPRDAFEAADSDDDDDDY